jgi:hypothetical protein
VVDVAEGALKLFAASDFFSVEVWTMRGLATHSVLFVISLVDRVVHIAGVTTRPDEAWMLQVGRIDRRGQRGVCVEALPDRRSRREIYSDGEVN